MVSIETSMFICASSSLACSSRFRLFWILLIRLSELEFLDGFLYGAASQGFTEASSPFVEARFFSEIESHVFACFLEATVTDTSLVDAIRDVLVARFVKFRVACC